MARESAVDADRETAVAAAAERLERAESERRPCPPVRDLLGAADVAAAYEVQQRITCRRLAGGARVVGRKIGLTSPAVQRQMGVAQPDFGVLFDDMDVSGLPAVPSERLLQPRVEAEIAFVLGEDLDEGTLDLARVRAAVDHAVPALEIVDSRITDWDIAISDTVADNASSGLFVLGDSHVPLADFQPVEVAMTLHLDGQVASRGNGAACLGDPLEALLWLARTARGLGDPLRAGQVVLSGALGPLVPVGPGARVEAGFSTLGTVSATFSHPEAPGEAP
ncbi:fumarylacetoacetate hydrolase family protein [Streptomyces sp. ID03-2B]|uniref:2-keto-4-pentenoate hydratase n=1 Tax=unclassified Streptomyces TaxID=2593676 RepID=UPI0020BDAF22|nr:MULTISPECIES: fumarylacetoacetate hydrolase family protein [unclassified Streptomyces]MDX3339032.1 fumarylacetoacetate hydrolase family protein [Streptomyces sp. ME02-6979.5a]MDX3506399.1 fumarylacetoacetate hydrolase family protein [Streptomyces sp. ATCC51928]MDX3589876.1 fumarylacetoacetate hydrolase family protein [Streptomyces sp. ID03-2B]MDX5522246.1 fumarylacetoacetate hydrolase family protein [Streptomyces sp. DE06-01C]WKN18938.1 fumarylacetoacetate hydrolase family protein [Streptom